jgi:hypothetical protein
LFITIFLTVNIKKYVLKLAGFNPSKYVGLNDKGLKTEIKNKTPWF